MFGRVLLGKHCFIYLYSSAKSREPIHFRPGIIDLYLGLIVLYDFSIYFKISLSIKYNVMI